MLGSGLLSTLTPTIHVPDAQYGFQVLMGVGLGLIGPNVYVVLKEVVSEDDLGEAPPLLIMLVLDDSLTLSSIL